MLQSRAAGVVGVRADLNDFLRGWFREELGLVVPSRTYVDTLPHQWRWPKASKVEEQGGRFDHLWYQSRGI